MAREFSTEMYNIDRATKKRLAQMQMATQRPASEIVRDAINHEVDLWDAKQVEKAEAELAEDYHAAGLLPPAVKDVDQEGG